MVFCLNQQIVPHQLYTHSNAASHPVLIVQHVKNIQVVVPDQPYLSNSRCHHSTDQVAVPAPWVPSLGSPYHGQMVSGTVTMLIITPCYFCVLWCPSSVGKCQLSMCTKKDLGHGSSDNPVFTREIRHTSKYTHVDETRRMNGEFILADVAC